MFWLFCTITSRHKFKNQDNSVSNLKRFSLQIYSLCCHHHLLVGYNECSTSDVTHSYLYFFPLFSPLRGKYYNLGTIKHGPKKENNNIFLIYEDGDDCGSGNKYSTRIQMECGSTEVSFQ